jgi:hypothetical protein
MYNISMVKTWAWECGRTFKGRDITIVIWKPLLWFKKDEVIIGKNKRYRFLIQCSVFDFRLKNKGE